MAKSDHIANLEPVAIIGYGHRMPGGIRTDEDFWNLLLKREIVKEYILDRYGRGHQPIGHFFGPSRLGSKFEGLVRDDEELEFDRAFFGSSYHQSRKMDPQIRMLLNCAWGAIECAGWTLESLRNSPTGVFVGTQISSLSNWRHQHGVYADLVPNLSLSMLANRVSYVFNLMGPSITMCTACSASLTAMHTARVSIANGECESALIGAVTYLASGRQSSAFNMMGVISPDGVSHCFDAEANGYMRSEGAFMYAIKPLSSAERDGDHIFAVIEATALNTAGTADGAEGLSPGRQITAPTQHSQIALMRQAASLAGRQLDDFDYIEAHATGTPVGDPIEGNAISTAFKSSEREVPLRLGSVKSNVGHLEAAAFACSLMKVILMIKHRTFAPMSRSYQIPNPNIDFDACPMEVQTTVEPFPDRTVLFGINSFGFGGSNGHCLVSEYRPARRFISSIPIAPDAGYLVPLSARTSTALVETAKRLRHFLEDQPHSLYTLAGNLSLRRTHFPVRTSFAVHTLEELKSALDSFIESEPEPALFPVSGKDQWIAMVFSGQGTQWVGCGEALYREHPVFRRALDAIDEYWQHYASTSLLYACFSAPEEQLNECELAQPVIFAIQCALVELLKTYGVYADCVLGHSCGEVAAAYAAGLLSLADATRLVYHRATLQQRVAGSGRMLAIGLDRSGVESLLDNLGISYGYGVGIEPMVQIACENSPANTVLAGTEPTLLTIVEALNEQNLQNRLLPGNIAFHSHAMDPLQDAAMEAFAFLRDRSFDGEIPFISTVTGKQTSQIDATYWWSNIREPVRFAAAMETVLRDHQPDIVLELAPHSALQPILMQCLNGHSDSPAVIPTFYRDGNVCLDFHASLGKLFQAGVTLDLESQFPKPVTITHLLPGYPHENKKLIDFYSDDEQFLGGADYAWGPLVGHRLSGVHPLFEARFFESAFPWLIDHKVNNTAIMPAGGFVEMVLQALEGNPLVIERLEFQSSCPIAREPVRLHTSLVPVQNSPNEFLITISTQPYEIGAQSEVHCRGKVHLIDSDWTPNAPLNFHDIDTSAFRSAGYANAEEFYSLSDAVLDDLFEYGPNFRVLQNLQEDPKTNRFLFELEINEDVWRDGYEEGYVIFPSLIDGGMQSFLHDYIPNSNFSTIPHRFENVTFLHKSTVPRLIGIAYYNPPSWNEQDEFGQVSVKTTERLAGSVSYYDAETGDLVLHIDKYYSLNANSNMVDLPRSKFHFQWQPKFLEDGARIASDLPNETLEPAALLSLIGKGRGTNLRAFCAIEFANTKEPDQTILHCCLNSSSEWGSPGQYWLVNDDQASTQTCIQSFRKESIPLRFITLDPSERTESALNHGLLRKSVADALFLHLAPGEQSFLESDWLFWHQLLAEGGLAWISHEENLDLEISSGWKRIRTDGHVTLLQSVVLETTHSTTSDSVRWIMGERQSLARDWLSLFDNSNVHAVPYGEWIEEDPFESSRYPEANHVKAIDFFFGYNLDDPTGEQAVADLVSFLQVFTPFRVANASCPCQLTVITVKAAHDIENPRGSALWGAVRSITLETAPEAKIDFRLVDLGGAVDLPALKKLIQHDLREREISLREGKIWVPRITCDSATHPIVPDGEDVPYLLTISAVGQISGLQVKTYDPEELDCHSVEVIMDTAALNFRDVMITLGLLPKMAVEHSGIGAKIGMEGSGVIARKGSAVTELEVGDKVVVGTGGCFTNRLIVNQYRVFRAPARLSLEESGASLSVYSTAYYALIHLARLQEGQRVLIHSAMGGVGQAAIALAKHVGAEIYATAGTDSKRNSLIELGVRAAFDSHSTSWYDALMHATDGKGVDVVLNSLAGSHIPLCLRALSPGGWHCEIGKIDIYADQSLGMQVFRKNLRFAAIDMDRLMIDDPFLSRQISESCVNLLDQGTVPPLPTTTFRYASHKDAFRFMMSGQHLGKIILKLPSTPSERLFPIVDRRPFMDPRATYLVTGAFGGLGLRLLRYLAAVGARHFTLMDRNPERGRDVTWLREAVDTEKFTNCVDVDIVVADISNESDVKRCIAGLKRPLKGVFHLAGILDDQILADLTPDSIANVFAPKANGALYLHRATSGMNLDHFVLFSSTTSVLGNPGQINYGAANSYLDGLANWRLQQGLPALSYNLAAVKDTGMAVRNFGVLRLMRASGMPPLSSLFVITNLDYALRNRAQKDHLVTALFKKIFWTVDHDDYLRTGILIRNQDAVDVGVADHLTLEDIVLLIKNKVVELCDHDEFGADDLLSSLGLTSLSVAELGAFTKSTFNFQPSALELMTTATCTTLAQAILQDDVQETSQDSETASETVSSSSNDSGLRSRRIPSIFASALADHFPS